MKTKRVRNPANSIKKQCHHCGNKTLQNLILVQNGTKLFEQIYSEKYFEPYQFLIYKCSTCECPNVYGQFEFYLTNTKRDVERYDLLYPKPPLLPDTVPEKLALLYEEIYHLRHQAPNAFANQIRRGLEFICNHQKASGETLSNKLEDLYNKGKFPGQFKDLGDLIRIVDNMGSHASKNDIDIWTAELLNDFFLIIIEYLYIAPSKVKNLKRLTKQRKKPNN